MSAIAAILDCYTVEPSGLGVPPYLSTYVREAFSALTRARPDASVRYVTIDDVRWCLNGGEPFQALPLSDPLTYSVTRNREDALKILRDAEAVVVVAGDAVPSVHLHAQNGSGEEIARAMACTRGRKVLLGPLATHTLTDPKPYLGLFDAVHTHTITAGDVISNSRLAADYEKLRADRDAYDDLVAQMAWTPIAEIELYRGCTRRDFCSFCNEPIKSWNVVFRTPDDVLDEIVRLYRAGVRHFRLGQQTCFFSYYHRDPGRIEQLLASVREQCPDLAVLHIDNVDPLAAASRVGARIAELVVRYCTEGNCAPMGIESFDEAVIDRNHLTCTPEVMMRAIANVNEVGARVGPLGTPVLLPGLNIIYGLPGETHRTHFENLSWLVRILDQGYLCHRTNVRRARVIPGTPLAGERAEEAPPSTQYFDAWKADVSHIYDQEMKRRVYPVGRVLKDLHSFFVSTLGTCHRRLGSYPVQVVERDEVRDLYQPSNLVVTGHAPRFLFGRCNA